MKGQYDLDPAQLPHLVEERTSATGLTMAQIQLLQGPRPQHLTRHPASADSPTMAPMIQHSKTSSSRPSGAILRQPPNSGAYSIASNSHQLVDVKKSQLRLMRYCGHIMLSMQPTSWTSSRGRRVYSLAILWCLQSQMARQAILLLGHCSMGCFRMHRDRSSILPTRWEPLGTRRRYRVLSGARLQSSP
jgi:hypothetical protein